MVFQFSTMKVIQAAAVLLREHAGRMSRLRLLKLLYIADRECLAETLRPITGDRAVAMDHGPVPSRTYDLMKRKDTDSPLWDRYISQEGPQDHRLIQDPGVGKLTRREVDKLHRVSETHREMNDYDIAVETHGFDEWVRNKPPQGSSKTIPLDDVLQALNLTQHKERIEAEAKAAAAFDREIAAVRRKQPFVEAARSA